MGEKFHLAGDTGLVELGRVWNVSTTSEPMAKTKSPTTSAPLPPLPPARIVQHLHWPIDDYRTVQRAAHAIGVSLADYVRSRALIAAGAILVGTDERLPRKRRTK